MTFLLALSPAPASAAIPASIFQFGSYGSGAGQLRDEGGGIAADPTTGHIFVSDVDNRRIDEFTAWGEFVKAWGWGVEDGAAELQTCGPAQPQLEPEPSLCQIGANGAGVGQMSAPAGIALAPGGDLYVYERNNQRVQVFDQSGAFVRMFGGEVDKTTGADVCTAADVSGGDECGAGIGGTGPSEFSFLEKRTSFNDYLDIAADGTVYVGDKDRIQKFDEDGNYLSSLPLPEAGAVGALALDPSGSDLYFGYAWNFDAAKAFRLNASSGASVYQLATTAPEALATDPAGNLFVADDPVPGDNSQPEFNPHLLEFDSTGTLVDECCSSTTQSLEDVKLPALETNVVSAGGGVDLYGLHASFGGEVGFVEVRGPAPDKWPPPVLPPTIESQHAVSVGQEEATLRATVNPNFWADTSYHLEWGNSPCSGGGCTATSDLALGAGVVRRGVQTEAIELEGLAPDTTYNYRFVAESGGGGPVFGPDRSFATWGPEAEVSACPNDQYRSGLGALLRDCRAYEMVSPVDKAGGDILVQSNQQGATARLDQATPGGEGITYSSYRSFGDTGGAPYVSQYLAARGASGWLTRAISPPQHSGVFNGSKLDTNFKAFSEDLSTAWLVQDADPPLAAGAVPGFPNLYRRDNLGDGYEALTKEAPPGTSSQDYTIEPQGFSADGTRTFFRANAKLTTNAASGGSFQIYESFNGKLRLVSLKPGPGGLPSGANASVGTLGPYANGREANAETAVSEDGTKVYWSEGVGDGKIYVRVNTVKTVSVSAGDGYFWAASPSGSQAIYQEGGALKLFTLANESSTTLLAEGVEGVVGASEDLTRIYVVSSANPAGRPSLYLFEAGQPLRLIAPLSLQDAGGELSLPSPSALSPLFHLARVTPDGAVAVFVSRGALTGADNVDSESGNADAEVFRYEASGNELRCLSCSPAGEAPRGGVLEPRQVAGPSYWYASRIPGWELQLHAPRVISAGGDRVFFDSLNRLVAADENEAEDVYEWEAPGTGTCSEASPDYNPEAGGCLSLLSSGSDERGSEFVDASAAGRDVFLLSGQSLVGWDPGQFDLYDAREGGGLPAPPVSRGPECEGEGCQPQSTPPPPAGNSSEASLPGNPTFKRPCKKGFARRHGKCVKKQQKKHEKRHHKRKARR